MLNVYQSRRLFSISRRIGAYAWFALFWSLWNPWTHGCPSVWASESDLTNKFLRLRRHPLKSIYTAAANSALRGAEWHFISFALLSIAFTTNETVTESGRSLGILNVHSHAAGERIRLCARSLTLSQRIAQSTHITQVDPYRDNEQRRASFISQKASAMLMFSISIHSENSLWDSALWKKLPLASCQEFLRPIWFWGDSLHFQRSSLVSQILKKGGWKCSCSRFLSIQGSALSKAGLFHLENKQSKITKGNNKFWHDSLQVYCHFNRSRSWSPVETHSSIMKYCSECSSRARALNKLKTAHLLVFTSSR